jgi:AcrR family transcriptional regulator
MTEPATERRQPRWERLGPDERRAQILRAARELFAQRQYASVSMEEVALAAGVRRGLVNHYFGAKRDLFMEVVREMLGSFGHAFPLPEPDPEPEGDNADNAGSSRSIEQVVADHVGRWLDVVEGDAETWFAILGAEGFGRDPDVERLVDRARDAMVAGIVEVLGQPASDELRVVLRAYSGLAEIVTREWLQRRRIDRRQAEALLASALLSLVRDVVPAVRDAVSPRRNKANHR